MRSGSGVSQEEFDLSLLRSPTLCKSFGWRDGRSQRTDTRGDFTVRIIEFKQRRTVRLCASYTDPNMLPYNAIATVTNRQIVTIAGFFCIGPAVRLIRLFDTCCTIFLFNNGHYDLTPFLCRRIFNMYCEPFNVLSLYPPVTPPQHYPHAVRLRWYIVGPVACVRYTRFWPERISPFVSPSIQANTVISWTWSTYPLFVRYTLLNMIVPTIHCTHAGWSCNWILLIVIQAVDTLRALTCNRQEYWHTFATMPCYTWWPLYLLPLCLSLQPIYVLIMHRPYTGIRLSSFNLFACGDTHAVLEHLSAFATHMAGLLGQRPP